MTRSLLLGALVAVSLLTTESLGQTGRSGGTASFGGAGFGARGFGGGGFGSSLNLGGGGRGFGGSAFGGGGGSFGANRNGAQSLFGNANPGQETPYVGRGGETAFVGRGTGDSNRALRNQPRQRTSRERASSGSGESNAAARLPVRLVASTELLAAIRQPAIASGPRSRIAGVTFTSAGGVTVLEGVVDTPSQRRVAERLAALEPGVGAIENRLRVRGEAVEIVPPPR